MLYVVCGLIGAGKNTYVESVIKPNEYLSDFDDCGFDKMIQLENTISNLENDINVYHITCYPTPYEMEFFNTVKDIEFIWINTSLEQSIKNVYKRNRERDIVDIVKVAETNVVKRNSYARSRLPFTVIDLFETNERW